MGKSAARAARVACGCVGIAVLFWSLRSPWLREPDGTLSGAIVLAIAGVVALLATSASASTRYLAFVLWTSVALVGQALALQAINAGRALHYQHLETVAVLWRTRPWLLAGIGVQVILVGTALAGRAQALLQSVRRTTKLWRFGAAVVLSVLTAATVSPAVSRYISELAFAAALQLLGLATILVVALAFPTDRLPQAQRWLDRLFGAPRDAGTVKSLAPDSVAWCGAAFVVIVAALLNVTSYQRHPHIKDEVVYLYHARYLAAGMLSMPAPPVPQAFDIELMYFEPARWFCPVPPGWPSVLALGVLAGAPWLVNPILGGINILLTFMVLAHLYGRRTARLGVLLLSLSPWHLFLAMSFMTHTFTLTCALLAGLGVVMAQRVGKARWGLLAGCSVGAVSLIRPLEGVIIGVPIALWAIGIGGPRLNKASLAALAFGTIVVGSVTFPYNRFLTGDALRFPINAYTDKYYGHNSNAYGFGPDRGMGWALDPNPGHGPLDATINANLNTFSLNTELFGWSTGSLLFIALLLCSGAMSKADGMMLAVVGVVFVAYFFYYFSGGPDFGARYWFLMIVPLVALTASGIQWLERTGAGPRVGIAVVALMALACTNYIPWRAIDKYYHYQDMSPGVRELAREHRFDGSLVLVRGLRFPDYESAAMENPLDLTSGAPIYAWDRNAAVRAATLQAYSGRPVWIVDGPTRTHAGYRIVQGPLPAADVMAETRVTR